MRSSRLGRALVTGGAGFIGSNLVRRLAAEGVAVRVIDDLSTGLRRNLDGLAGVELITGDVRDEALLGAAIEGVDTVFHLAASVGNKRSIDEPVHDAEVNVLGTVRLLEAIRRGGVARLVVSSSAGIFGELVTMPIAEGHPVEPDTPYGATKLCQEKLALAYGKLHGITVSCLRYFNIYGPHQRFDEYGNVIPIFVFRLLRGEPLTIYGDGEQTRDFLNVRDVADANILAATRAGAPDAYNLGSGARITINRLVEVIQEVAGAKARIEHGPPRPGDVRDSMADTAKAARDLGFTPSVELTEGLTEYIAWARYEVSR